MDKLLAYFIKYPIAVNLIVLTFFVLGLLGLKSLSSSFFPLQKSNIIRISVFYPGASPQEMEEGVVLKIENNLKGIVGIDRVTSVSKENHATITVETKTNADIDVVLGEVQNAVDKVPTFPAGMEPPVIAKVEAARETISFVVDGKGVPLHVLKKKAQEIEMDLRRMDGISMVTLEGFPPEEIEIAVQEMKLRAYQLSFREVAAAVASNNLLTTGGRIKTDAEEYLIRANHRSYHAKDLQNIIVKARADGSVVYLKDVAVLRDRFNEDPNSLAFNGKRAVKITVKNTNSEDLLESAAKIKAYIRDYNRKHKDVHLDIVLDSSITLQQRTHLLVNNAWQGILLVLLFLSLFLKPRLALWVAFGIPVAFMGMFALAGQFGVTINVLSLFGMIIVVGILVDDGIVIAENIYAHYERGEKPLQAAIKGTKEVIPPVLSAVLTTILAFMTFLFMEGKIGDFFGEVSIIVILTLSFSLVEAMFILPAHIAHSGGLDRKRRPYKFNQYGDRIMRFMRDRMYMPVFRFFIRNKLLGFSVFLTLLLLTIGAIRGGIIRMTFFPEVSSDKIVVNLSMPQGTNVRITDSIISVIEKRAWEVNAAYQKKQSRGDSVIRNIIKTIGPGSSVASLKINLLQGELRDFTAAEITRDIQEASGEFYGVENLSFGSGTMFGGKPVSISLVSNNIQELKAAKQMLKAEMKKIKGLKDITDNDPRGIKEIRISLKPNAYLLGLTLNDVMAQVRSAFFGRQVQRFQRGQDEIKVWVRYVENERKSIKNLNDMRILTPQGKRIPLSEIAVYSVARGDIAINHLNGQREIQINADMKNSKASASDFLEDIRERIIPRIQAKYPGVSALYEGQNRSAEKIKKSASKVFPVMLFLIFLVIALTFRSYSQPFILVGLIPFALVGIGWGHRFHGLPLNMLSILGIIALIGIMVNDGLVLISKFNINLKKGMKFDDALLEAGKSRFRAIFLTTITTVGGMTPLLFFEKSFQAQFLKPMAISITWGIAYATVLTLLLLPIFLGFVNSIKVYALYLWEGKKPAKEDVERAVKEMRSLDM